MVDYTSIPCYIMSAVAVHPTLFERQRMFGNRNPIAAYSQHGLEAQVESASPHQLILMLFDGASSALNIARIHMAAKEFEQKGALINRAIEIISSGLRASLDMSVGELSMRLDSLYEYMIQRLCEANAHNDVAALDEVSMLLLEIHTAWKEIGEKGNEALH